MTTCAYRMNFHPIAHAVLSMIVPRAVKPSLKWRDDKKKVRSKTTGRLSYDQAWRKGWKV